MYKLLVIAAIFSFAAYQVGQIYQFLYAEKPLPDLDFDRYWGPGAKKPKEIAIHKIILSFEDAVIDKLKLQLNDTSYLAAPLEGVNFEYGMNTETLKGIVEYWKNDYLKRWYEEREWYIGKYPMFQTKIQGLDVHYVHVYPENAPKTSKVIPLLLLHGWPGSILEYYEVIPELVKLSMHKSFVFEFIIPFIPGFCQSEAPHKQGFDSVQTAIVFNNLMQRIGVEKYYIHGGDWGSIIGNHMATLFPEHVLGYHSILCSTNTPLSMLKTFIASFWPSMFIEESRIDWFYPQMPHLWTLLEESGYFHIQATKPDTIGAALTGNPVGLAAYILEKYSTATNKANRNKKNGGFNETIHIDRILDIIMLYHASNSITSSMRFYKETMASENPRILDTRKVTVPTACARFKHDIRHLSDFVLKDKFVNLVQSTYHEKGGHFAAMELPDVLAKDIFDFVSKVEMNKK
ncbi:juvenile hormone epoxide hydrolase 2-like [Culicoides brevitarsis]|uniref:juvenile hormone epoxide hydrolase 2-like n=1 Tax=Culicoides brevitarsis TaxID=469753 RepID=UPI00307BF765